MGTLHLREIYASSRSECKNVSQLAVEFIRATFCTRPNRSGHYVSRNMNVNRSRIEYKWCRAKKSCQELCFSLRLLNGDPDGGICVPTRTNRI